MGWSIGYDSNNKRDVGYGVPANCDHPQCDEKINRGLSFVCGGMPYSEHGCGLHFCSEHLTYEKRDNEFFQLCEKCANDKAPFIGKPDREEWINHKLNDESWAEWRAQNPEEVDALTSSNPSTLQSEKQGN